MKNTPSRPFHDGVAVYANLGWDGILAIQPNSKIPAEQFVTGRHPQLTAEECVLRAPIYPRHNIALRLPLGVVGLDVDAYDQRGGDKTLRRLEAQYGKLPAAPYSTARGAGPSGILMYRTRTNRRLVPQVKPGMEIVQQHHRFVMCSPSIHPSGSRYEWYFGNERLDRPPMLSELPFLPPRWERGLSAPVRSLTVPAPTGPLPSRVDTLPGLLRALRAAADRLAALPVSSEANDPCNQAALDFSKYAPHDISADAIRDELRRGVAAWKQGHDRGYAAIEQGLSVIGTERHQPRPWIDIEGAGWTTEVGK